MVFYNPGKSTLRAGQKLILRDLVDSLKGRTAINISVIARRHNSTNKSLGKARNTAVVRYLRSLGVEATFIRENRVGPSGSSLAKKNNRVTISASWTNPIS
jgi:outer membrane protein OmpA-like peptidoglycan-associated protein